MEYTIYYETVQLYEVTVEADSPKEALQSTLEQWDNDEYWPFDTYMEPMVTKAWINELSEDDDPKTISPGWSRNNAVTETVQRDSVRNIRFLRGYSPYNRLSPLPLHIYTGNKKEARKIEIYELPTA